MSRTKYEVRLLRVAEEDLTDIIVYIAADRPTVAAKLANRFNQKLSVLSDNPRIGSIPKEDSLAQLGYRYLVIENYLIFYVIEDQTIYVHRIIHGARDYTHVL
jgi:toxin ParE1/3/4